MLVQQTSYSFYLVQSIFTGENPTVVCLLFIKKKQKTTTTAKQTSNVGLQADIYRQISLKLDMMIQTTKPYMLTFIQGYSGIRNQIIRCPFSGKFRC